MSAPDDPGAPGAAARRRAAERRRLAEVFGDVLPEQSRDDTDSGETDRGDSDSNDARLRDQVPPHHGPV